MPLGRLCVDLARPIPGAVGAKHDVLGHFRPLWELIGKHLNMFIERKVVEFNMVDDSDEYLARLMEIVGVKTIDQEPAQLQLENDGPKDGSVEDGQPDAIDIIR